MIRWILWIFWSNYSEIWGCHCGKWKAPRNRKYFDSAGLFVVRRRLCRDVWTIQARGRLWLSNEFVAWSFFLAVGEFLRWIVANCPFFFWFADICKFIGEFVNSAGGNYPFYLWRASVCTFFGEFPCYASRNSPKEFTRRRLWLVSRFPRAWIEQTGVVKWHHDDCSVLRTPAIVTPYSHIGKLTLPCYAHKGGRK